MFYLAGVGLSFFLNLLLLSKIKKILADKILAAWLLIVTLHLLLFYLRNTWLYPELLGSEMALPLLHGPFLYLYTLTLTNRTPSIRVSLIHFLPFLAVFFYMIPFLALPVEQKIYVFKNNGKGYEIFSQIRIIAVIVSGVFYVALSSLVLRKHRISIANQFSNTEKINLDWLQYLIYWIGVIWFFVILGNDSWIFGTVVLFILFIGFFGIRQVGVFHSNEVLSPQIEEEPNQERLIEEAEPEKRKYQKSGLSIEASEKLHQQLVQLINQEKLFRESELSLSELASRLNTQANYLSQVINEQEGKNFYDYINTLRIEEFKLVAASPESRKYTMLALAQHCGFNSKSSFNRYFKKVTGQSPSEFVFIESVSKK